MFDALRRRFKRPER